MISSAVRHVLLRQGCVGIKVKIMLDWDPKGRTGPKTPIPDTVTIHNPKDEDESSPSPTSARNSTCKAAGSHASRVGLRRRGCASLRGYSRD